MNQYQNETLGFVDEMRGILQRNEDLSQATALTEFSQIIDRIMGAARVLAGLNGDDSGALNSMARYTELGKHIAKKTAQLKTNPPLYKASHLLLNYILNKMQRHFLIPLNRKHLFNPEFEERARKLMSLLDQELKMDGSLDYVTQKEIEQLLDESERAKV